MIDEKLQVELRDRFNPEGSDLRKLQLRILEILKFVDSVCKTHGIQYWLSSEHVLARYVMEDLYLGMTMLILRCSKRIISGSAK